MDENWTNNNKAGPRKEGQHDLYKISQNPRIMFSPSKLEGRSQTDDSHSVRGWGNEKGTQAVCPLSQKGENLLISSSIKSHGGKRGDDKNRVLWHNREKQRFAQRLPDSNSLFLPCLMWCQWTGLCKAHRSLPILVNSQKLFKRFLQNFNTKPELKAIWNLYLSMIEANTHFPGETILRTTCSYVIHVCFLASKQNFSSKNAYYFNGSTLEYGHVD